MKRRDFLKMLGIAPIAAPAVARAMTEQQVLEGPAPKPIEILGPPGHPILTHRRYTVDFVSYDCPEAIHIFRAGEPFEIEGVQAIITDIACEYRAGGVPEIRGTAILSGPIDHAALFNPTPGAPFRITHLTCEAPAAEWDAERPWGRYA